jgi:D-3-phosphoglycerate dehydrogenase
MDEHFLIGAKNLEFIARSGAGMENIDEAYCESRGIALYNAPEGNRNAVAEHALGMLLALFRKIISGDRQVRQNQWDREGHRGIELDGKTIAIIGFGNNGSAFAKKLSGFDVRVLVYDKYKEVCDLGQIESSDLDLIYEEADVVSFHVPQTNETINWANDAFFAKFKKPIFLLNMARGKIVNTKDLLRSLDSGKVLGACLDVLEFEDASFALSEGDKIKSELFRRENVLFSPHIAGWTVESYFLLSDVLADKILSR